MAVCYNGVQHFVPVELEISYLDPPSLENSEKDASRGMPFELCEHPLLNKT